MSNLSAYTGRTNRGVKADYYRVTLNSYAPSVLIEMGFVTNPEEYDSLCSRNGIFQTANAIGDSIVSYLS
jgi:N-acetylmuramoyl-L-alanine amidase